MKNMIAALKFKNASQILTILALILALWQTWLALESQRETTIQAQQLRKIEEKLSTRYLGKFPEYVNDIARLIETAKTRLDFFYDVPGYGALSNPEGWVEIKYAIEKKLALGVPVKAALYSPEWRRNVLEEQFFYKEDKWNDWIKSPEVALKVNNYLARYGYDEQADSLTSERYVEISMAVQEKILQNVFSSADVTLINELMPIYFWIVDDREAIFVIPSFSENSSELAFYTYDASMIKALKEMRGRYIKMAQ